MHRGAEVEVVSPAPREAWRQAVAADSGALISHTPEWLDTICAVDGWKDASRLYVWPSGRQLVLPMVAKRIGKFAVVEDSLPHGWGFGGLVGAGAVTPDEAAAVCADLVARRLLRLRVCPNSLQGSAWSQALALGPPNAITIPCRAHAINLDGGVGAVWKRFSDNARRGVRKAEKQGVEIECDTTGRLLGVFDELLTLSMRRWARQQKEPLWLARLRQRRLGPRSRWRQIAERTAGGVAIWVARWRGQPAAAIVVLRGPNDHYTRGAMHKELAGPSRANVLLQWLAIQDACQRGARWYQMGQSGWDGDPVGRFKESFGARGYEFPDIRLERFPEITRLVRSMRAGARTLVTGRS
ncbi:MAG: GNAT family N-acetyltransferase [Methylocystis sp.]|nr:GNAT family N-acetyltransferase [Methylocystis sp.]